MNNTYGLQELQQTMLNMLIDLHNFCTSNGIEYSLAYGSALGAVRHKGFIPWDDDVDIYMSYKSYKRFCSLFDDFSKGKYYLQRFGSVNNDCAIPKIRMNHTYFFDPAFDGLEMHKGIYIDIFILYDAPASLLKRKMQYLASLYVLAKSLSNNPNYRNMGFKKDFLMALLRCFPKSFLLGKAFKKLKSFSDNDCCFYLDIDQSTFKKAFLPHEMIFPSRTESFEGYMLNIPSKAEDYLKLCYGDFLKTPSEEQIAKARHSLVWDTHKEIDYSSSMNNSFRDERIK